MRQELIAINVLDSRGNPSGGYVAGLGLRIDWQNGPLVQDGDRLRPNGCFVETVIRAAVERLEFYQSTKFSSNWNTVALEHLNMALLALGSRTKDREKRGVEGTHEE